jgi:hypothetical protein
MRARAAVGHRPRDLVAKQEKIFPHAVVGGDDERASERASKVFCVDAANDERQTRRTRRGAGQVFVKKKKKK